MIVWTVQHLQSLILGADTCTTLGCGACGTDPFGAATVLHEFHIAMPTVVQFNRLSLTLGVVEDSRCNRWRKTKRVYVYREASGVYIGAVYHICISNYLVAVEALAKFIKIAFT